MNDNVRKVFDILGVEPNERFKIEGIEEANYSIDERLNVKKNNELCSNKGLAGLLNGYFKIIKLSKQKKKLRDVTPEDYEKWFNDVCFNRMVACRECMFNNVFCESDSKYCWVKHKDLYSDKFLDQEIEVE